MPKLLFVDDELSLRLTLPAILQMHGYLVRVAATVPEALRAIQAEKFDVLLTDLNIGQPGDGFTVVSAMRRTQPEAVTIILTGYPAFQTALEAIRNQVDDYIVKPANVEMLVGLLERKLLDRDYVHNPLDQKHLSQLLRENLELIADRWLGEICKDQEFASLGLDGDEQYGYLVDKLRLISGMLEGKDFDNEAVASARRFGECRSLQGASLNLVLQEARVARHVILGVIQENLLVVNVSRVIGEIIDICDWLDKIEEQTLISYMQCSQTTRPGRKAARPS
ncbi:MAG: hypothetical protein CXZ00_04290 [Acidobacteria bacterium]|nr:MAG: hypothetical protein CXZ00_04290 [Acidobacteriota bacterium]